MIGIGTALMGLGSGTSLLGMLKGRRNNNRMRDYASDMSNFSVDTSEMESLLGRLQSQDLEGQAIRDTRAAGLAFDDARFMQNTGMRGGGRNTFGKLRQEASERGQNRFGSAAMGRLGQLQSQNVAQQIGANQSLMGQRGDARRLQAQMMSGYFNNKAQSAQNLSNLGMGLIGMGGQKVWGNAFNNSGSGGGGGAATPSGPWWKR